ncbi:glucose-1-phosphate thymidylyltransferase [Candidatus Altiarchaeales archaeon WOR_SM1_SCG]|nr:glucose-1-phosphate thymidylyltransferase [Candidatus Altiarchaeales archaeon WOR_SM1_SCG]
MKGLILAGGSGTRLRPITHTANKHLIPIANKPILFYGIETLKEAGIKDIGIILGENDPEAVKNAVGDGSGFGINVTYIYQGEPKGLAHAVSCAEEFIGDESFVMYLGDNLLKKGINELVADFKKNNHDAVIALCKVKNPQQFGVAEMDHNRVVRLVEKPGNPKSDLALVGVYVFKPVIFDSIRKIKPSLRGELEITDAIQGLLNDGCNVQAHIVKGWWKDTGKPEDLLEANHLILDDIEPLNKAKIEDGVKVHGRVAIGEGTIIKEGSVIRGPISIGSNCSIGPDTYIGPYTSIGNNTVIRRGEIESSIIISDTIIDCGGKIVDSLIGKNSRIISRETLPKGYRFVIGENSEVNI